MASDIRELLAAAQKAEVEGRAAEAVRLLEQAAIFFRDRGMGARALQMLRQMRRVQGRPDPAPGEEAHLPQHHLSVEAAVDDLGFGDSLMDPPAAPEGDRAEPVRAQRESLDLAQLERSPALADPGVDAWCSFCCRPKVEAGSLVAGPAGAFICLRCSQLSSSLLGAEAGRAAPAPADPEPAPEAGAAPRSRGSTSLVRNGSPLGPSLSRDPDSPELRPPEAVGLSLPAQARARDHLAQHRPRLALVVGPEGAGKSALLRQLGRPAPFPLAVLPEDLLLLDLPAELSLVDEAKVLSWLDEQPRRRAVLAVRGSPPRPALVLTGEQGEEPVFDTPALHEAVERRLSLTLLSRIDAVLPLEAPGAKELAVLARGLLSARGAVLPEEAVAQVVQLAERSGRGAHELAALVGRIPAGTYQAR